MEFLIYTIVGVLFLVMLGLCIIEKMLANLKSTLEELHNLSRNVIDE